MFFFLTTIACSPQTVRQPAAGGGGQGGSPATTASGMGGANSTSASSSASGFGGFPGNPDCGNSQLDDGETCDDGNQNSSDGCSAACTVECGYLCNEAGKPCLAGFHGVQCDSPGSPLGQASPIPNTCRIATLSVDGDYIRLSLPTRIGDQPRHLDAMYTDGQNQLFGFAGDTENLAAGSHLVSIDAKSGQLTSIGKDLGVWVMGAAMNDAGELWITTFETYEQNGTSQVHIARANPLTGALLVGPTLLTSAANPVTVWSSHVSDVAFRHDGAMFISANAPGPLPPEPVSRYYEVDPNTATVLSTTDGPDDIYAAGIVFVGQAKQILAMDIRGADDVFVLDLAAPPALAEQLLYPDPIPTNSGTADLAGCAKLPAPIPP